MNVLRKPINLLSQRARRRRGEMFRRHFTITSETRILDLGGGNGSHIASVLEGTPILPENVYIADIREKAVLEAQSRFGFNPVIMNETGRLPFPDRYFDIVFCSSVIEHVTVPKAVIWQLRDGAEFQRQARVRQREFAAELARLGKGFWVQTPNKMFPLESHSLLPLVGYLPREWLVPFLRISNRVWIKWTSPDWSLLDCSEMSKLFPSAEILRETFGGLTKSIIATKKG